MTIQQYIAAAFKDYVIDKKELPKGGLGHNFNTTFWQGLDFAVRDGCYMGMVVLFEHYKSDGSNDQDVLEWLNQKTLPYPPYMNLRNRNVLWNLYYWLKLLK